MQEVSSATTPALHSSRPSSSIATKGPTTTATDFGHFGSRACLSRNHLGSPRGVEWQEGDRQREREREREEGRKEERTPRKARLLLFLVAVVVHSGPSVRRRRRLCRRCKTRKATFSVLCEAALLSLSRRRTRTVGRTTQCCRLSLRPEHKGERAPSAARTQQRSTLRGGKNKNHLKGKRPPAPACPPSWAVMRVGADRMPRRGGRRGHTAASASMQRTEMTKPKR